MRIGYSTTNYIWNDLTKSFAENKWKWQIWSICKEKESRLWTCNSLNPCLCSVVQTTEGSVRSDIEGLFSSFQKFPLLSFSCLRLLSQAQPIDLWNSQETFGLKLGSHLVPLTACVFVGTFMWQAIGDALLKLVDRHGGIRLQFIHIFERMIVDPNILEELALNRCRRLNGKKMTYLLCEICTNYGSLFLPCLAELRWQCSILFWSAIRAADCRRTTRTVIGCVAEGMSN